jgi:hypothetical protein
MPDVGTAKKYLSQLVAGPIPFEGPDVANFFTARVNLTAVGGDVDYVVGTPLVWDATNTGFVPYVAQDISAAGASTLPDESPVAIFIGSAASAGEPVTVAEDGDTTCTVLFRGPIAVNTDGMELTGITSQNVSEFVVQLEKQEVKVISASTAVTPSHVDNS